MYVWQEGELQTMRLKKVLLGTIAGALLCNSVPATVFAGIGSVVQYDMATQTITDSSFRYEDTDDDEELPPYDGEKTSEKKIYFHRADGTVIVQNTNVNGRLRVPASKNQDGYTFLGWSENPGQTAKPQYQPGQVINVKKATHLYAVMYNWKQEPNIQVGNLANTLSKYSRIIFVGDSRTHYLRRTLLKEYGPNAISKVRFVCKSGEGLNWFEETGEALLQKEIALAGAEGKNKPVAVVFNLGVNDLSHRRSSDYKGMTNTYISYMNNLGDSLVNENCRLFYMSVNPTNTAMKPTRKESEILYFNNTLKNNLNGNFQWIDTYNYLMKNGYSTYNAFKGNIDDGVHYSTRTYKRIYKYCLKSI